MQLYSFFVFSSCSMSTVMVTLRCNFEVPVLYLNIFSFYATTSALTVQLGCVKFLLKATVKPLDEILHIRKRGDTINTC